jgi:5-methyltetrahydrofolate--homocysteine methyltransferase
MDLKILTEHIKRPIIFDGSMGGLLISRGFGEPPVTYNLTNPDLIKSVHSEYVAAGADVITANTFGAYPLRFAEWREMIKSALESAVSVSAESGRGNVYVALNLSPTGLFTQPVGTASFEELYHIFKECAIEGEKNGADFVIAETMQDVAEMRAAVLAVKENTRLPIICTASFSKFGRLLSGADVPTVVAALESLGADAVGINCGEGFESVKASLDDFLRYSSLPILLRPNAGIPTDGSYGMQPLVYADYLLKCVERGVHFVGGCCGTSPEHIRALSDACRSRNIVTRLVRFKDDVIISSGRKSVCLGPKPVLITPLRVNGENFDEIGETAHELYSDGAEILSLSVDSAEIALKDAVIAVSGQCPAPLALETKDPEALEAALRVSHGRTLVIGVTADDGELDRILPVVKKYGAVTVGFCSQRDTVKPPVDLRIFLARKILGRMAAFRINRKYAVIDPISTERFIRDYAQTSETLSDADYAELSMEMANSITQFAKELRVKTILDIGGLTEKFFRNNPHAVSFFSLALQAGLSGCVFSPSDFILKTVFSFNSANTVSM